MSRRTSMTLKLLLVLLVSLGFNCPGCGPPPTLTCDQVSISLDPGTCVEIPPPCDNHQWVRLDSFRLCDAPPGLFIQTQRTPRARFLCADTSVGTLVDEPVDYFYANTSETGVGQFRVTIGATPLTVTASAFPMSIPSGGTSQLNAMVSGGVAPYSFNWSGAGLSAANVASPTASPIVTTQYTVVVTDSIGDTANAAVIVNVGVAATATASPLTINPGQSSQLTVQASGGTPPYTFAWTPAATLNDPTLQNPLAMPTQRTTYDVTVTDFLGATAYASVTVQVVAAFQACFTVSGVGFSRNLDGNCSTPSGLTYRWWCDFRGVAQPPNGAGPNSLFTCLYETPGTKLLRLEVVDGSGATSATTQTVTVP